MAFEIIDKENWQRKEYFSHYFDNVSCTYSMSVKLDITTLKQSGKKLYPSMLYYMTTIVNRHKEFRTAINSSGELGIFDKMLPCYTVFHRESETFSNIWTNYTEDYESFCNECEKDVNDYKDKKGMFPKMPVPENTFPVSMIPWASFEGFNLNLKNGYDYLLPVFTMGKFYEEDGKILLPFSVQVHHAVCDGYHVCRFIGELQDLINKANK